MSSNLVSKLELERKKRSRFTIIMATVIIFLVLLSGVFLRLLLKNEKKEIELHFKEVTVQSALTADIFVTGNFATLQLLSEMLAVQPEIINNKNVMAFLIKENSKNKFESMSIIHPDGVAHILTKYFKSNKPLEINVKDETFFKEAISGKTSLTIFNSKIVPDKKILLYIVPILKDGEVIALVSGGQDLGALDKVIDIKSFDNAAYIYIIAPDGTLIHSSNNPEVFIKNSMYEENFGKNYNIADALKSSRASSFWVKDKSNSLKLAVLAPLEYNHWKILSVLSKNDINKNSKMVFRFAVIFFLLINIIVYITARYNILLRKKSNDMVMDLALRDDVTGAFNKTKFYIECEKILIKPIKESENLSMILMDIDNFKIINELYNIQKGDKVLTDVSEIIKANLGKHGIYARLTDDVFGVMFKYVDDEEIMKFVNNISDKLLDYKLSVKLVPSFGIYKVEDKTMPVNTMCDRATLAKRTVKGAIGLRCAFFNVDMTKSLLADKEIEDEMNKALLENQFLMYLQPKYDLKTKSVCGSEALVRWKHPVKGLIPPFKFIPLFEKNGFILQLDKYIWEQACKTIKKWIDEGKQPFPVSVNLSRIHFTDPSLAETIETLVTNYNVPHELLELELTESAFLDNEGIVNSTISKLQELGFTIAMDDFGTGYSSLNMLRKLPVNVLKLDRGFIQETTCCSRGMLVLSNIIHMAKDLNLKIVCEGIETIEQENLMRDAGCDIAQGFLFSKPIQLEEYEELVYTKTTKLGGFDV